jgi:hypothetical protein
MDQPLSQAWRTVLETSPYAGMLDAAYGDRVYHGLEQVRQATQALSDVRRIALDRIEPEPVVRERLRRPFQLIEFQNERQVRLEELNRLADQQKVRLGSAVAAGFPDYTAGRPYPELLWPQLNFAHHAVASALVSQVATVAVVRLPTMQFHPAGTNGASWLVEMPVEIELAGPGPNVLRFLEALPLRGNELKPRGLPEGSPGKPVLTVREVLLRKETRNETDRVALNLTVAGFVEVPRVGPAETRQIQFPP